jgi:hypothetical protein
VWGLGVHRVRDMAQMQELLAQDPARHILTYDIFPMPMGAVGPCAALEQWRDAPPPRLA